MRRGFAVEVVDDELISIHFGKTGAELTVDSLLIVRPASLVVQTRNFQQHARALGKLSVVTQFQRGLGFEHSNRPVWVIMYIEEAIATPEYPLCRRWPAQSGEFGAVMGCMR